MRLAVMLLLCLLPTACRQARRAAADPEQLVQADLAFARATATRGLAGFSSFLAEDAMTIRADAPVVKGARAVAGRWAPLLNNPALSITWQPQEASISAGGDLGFTVGTYEIVRTAGANRGPAGSGKYVTIWKRQPSGEWKVVFDSGVQDSAATTAP